MAIQQILHTWMLGEYPLEEIAEMLHRIGADGADISIAYDGSTSPESRMKQDIKGILSAYGLKTYVTSPLYFRRETDLSHSNPKARRTAIDFSKRCVEVAAHAGCDRMLVSAGWISVRYEPYISYEEDWKQAVESLVEVAEYAREHNVNLMLEPINRYRVLLVHTLSEAAKMIEDSGQQNIKILPDTFHMLIEETESIPKVLEKHIDKIGCLHIGDTGRTEAGKGSLDWEGIINAMLRCGFQGPFSHEPILLYFDEHKMGMDPAYTQYMEELFAYGITYIKELIQQRESLFR